MAQENKNHEVNVATGAAGADSEQSDTNVTTGENKLRGVGDEAEKKDNDPLSTDKDGLHNQIQTILGDIDGDGTISMEIADILNEYGVKLVVMSKWNKSKVSDFVEKLPLKSIKDDTIGLKRIAVNATFASGIKDLDQSNGM